MKPINLALLSLFVFALFYYGKFILLPLFLSLFVYVIIKSLTKKFVKIANQYLRFNLNEVLSFFIFLLISSFFFYFIWKILKFNLFQVIDKSEFYQNNLNFIINYFANSPINEILEISDVFNSVNFVSIFSNVLNSLTGLAGNFSLVLIYLIFLIVEDKHFATKLNKISKNKNTMKIVTKINNDIFNYFRLKTFTSLLTAVLTFLILQIVGSDLSIVFAIIAFFLNFIPFIGSLLSILFPFIFSCIQFLNIFDPLITLSLLIMIQIFIGNFLEPKLMGKALNISPIVMLIFLSIMGKLWGISGMFLSVPMLVVLLIVLSSFKNTRDLALLISEK